MKGRRGGVVEGCGDVEVICQVIKLAKSTE